MSKIQFNELNQNASELEVLNEAETTEVVGGFIAFSDASSRFNLGLVSADNTALVSQSGAFNGLQLGQSSGVSINQG